MKKLLDKPSKTIPCIMMLMLLSVATIKGDSTYTEPIKVQASINQNLEVKDKNSNELVVIEAPVPVEEIKQKHIYKPKTATVKKTQVKKKTNLSRGGSGIPKTTDVDSIRNYVNEIAKKYGMDPDLIMSVIQQESRFDPKARNGNCVGLMQMSTRWHANRAKRLGVKDFYDPYSNILLGVDYISEIYSGCKDMRLTLMIYNMGYSAAQKKFNNGQISSYAKTIIARAEH